MVSQSSILFLLAFSAVAVSARPLDRRAPMDQQGHPYQNLVKNVDNLRALNEVLACTSDKMKSLNFPLATADEPGQSPFPWLDAFQICRDIFSAKSGLAGPDENPSTEQVGPDGNPSTGGGAK
ncbi:hypothetical protein [Absidia glauca]|uniref:Uncharacterized protein n=1 Tax=Absidia glauca TaxID=4829 RepID=A0A168QED9_ABSGL|nr:hypothetical protein [Absidia glauca]